MLDAFAARDALRGPAGGREPRRARRSPATCAGHRRASGACACAPRRASGCSGAGEVVRVGPARGRVGVELPVASRPGAVPAATSTSPTSSSATRSGRCATACGASATRRSARSSTATGSGPSSRSPLVPKLAELGVCGGTIQGHGCPGLSPLGRRAWSAMELARGDGSVSTFHGVHSGLAMTAIGLLGSEEQKERWLPPMARLEADRRLRADRAGPRLRRRRASRRACAGWATATSSTAPSAGSATRPSPTSWSCGPATRAARSAPTSSRRARPGSRPRLITGKIAKRASWQADVTLTRRARAGREPARRGARASTTPRGCWPPPAPASPGARSATPSPPTRPRCAYALEREQFGTPIGGHQITQYRLAKMLADVTGHAPRSACASPSWSSRARSRPPWPAWPRCTTPPAPARSWPRPATCSAATACCWRTTSARHLGDVEVVATVEGTDVVHALIVGREITGISAFC